MFIIERTGTGYINVKKNHRSWKYLGHVLRKGEEIFEVCLSWNPAGQDGHGESVEAEMKATGSTWNTIGHTAQDRNQ